MKKFVALLSQPYKKFKQRQQTKLWLIEQGVLKFKILADMSVDVEGGVYLFHCDLTSIPVQFNHVGGDFNCSHNYLTSLQGCPKIVKGHFKCNNNFLPSLEWCPKWVGGNFNCSNNEIQNFEFLPQSFSKKFFCADNPSFPLPKEGAYTAEEAYQMQQTFLDIKHEHKALSHLLPSDTVKPKKNINKI